MDLVIITGMSGAGRMTALMALEDMGYFCIDNAPMELLEKLVELNQTTHGPSEKMAIGIMSRNSEDVATLKSLLHNLDERNIYYRLIFLDSENSILINRYKENRRPHPFSKQGINSLSDSINMERNLISTLKENAYNIIDTTFYSTKQLKQEIFDIFKNKDFNNLSVYLISFGFKFGTPIDQDMLFDVRCLPNPFYISNLKEKTGLDKPVSDYVLSFPESKTLLHKIEDLIDFTYPLYAKEGRKVLVVCIGCTGGKHRSITMVEETAKHLRKQNIPVIVSHRDKTRHK